MAEIEFRIMELTLQGFNCSQTLALLALEAQGKANPELVRALSALGRGLGCGKICGTLSGGCCVLGLYAGRGTAEEIEDGRLSLMLTELVEWFEETFGERYGGVNCADIIQNDPALRLGRCPEIVIETFRKLTEILEDNNYTLDGQSWAGRQ